LQLSVQLQHIHARFAGGRDLSYPYNYPYTLACRVAASTREVNYSSNVLLLEFSLIFIPGCKFPNCSFNNSENAPIHLLFSNLARGLALDRRASL